MAAAERQQGGESEDILSFGSLPILQSIFVFLPLHQFARAAPRSEENLADRCAWEALISPSFSAWASASLRLARLVRDWAEAADPGRTARFQFAFLLFAGSRRGSGLGLSVALILRLAVLLIVFGLVLLLVTRGWSFCSSPLSPLILLLFRPLALLILFCSV